jgi:hypothetical protein
MLANVIEGADAWMIQVRNHLGFTFEALSASRIGGKAQNFYGDRASEPSVAGTINLTHPSRSERPYHLIRPEFCTRCQRHGEPDYT